MSQIREKLSRRTVLRNAAVLVGVTGSAAFAASCQPLPPPAPPPPMAQPGPPPPPPMPLRMAKAQAAYQDFPRGPQRCGVCRNFVGPNDCRAVQGPVSPQGWCRQFNPMMPGGERG